MLLRPIFSALTAAAVVLHIAGAAAAAAASAAAAPNLVFILTDDMGSGYPGYNNPDVKTPAIDGLAAEGVRINTWYTYQFCAPSRGAALTGRWPFRLSSTRINYLPSYVQDGTDLGYSMLPKRLAQSDAHYVSYHIGKWHQGLYAPQFTPLYRGFNESNGFLCGGEDHFDQTADLNVGNCGQPSNVTAIRDIWVGNATDPAEVDRYTGTRFNDAAVTAISTHKAKYGADTPLFMYLALHNTHGPTEALPEFEALYPNVSYPLQKTFYGMVSTVDSTVANVTAALKASGMWDNTVLLWATDNGSPIQVAGSNYPYRGGKGTNWEGGVRCPALVSGGVVPQSRWGAKATGGHMHIVDVYATFLALAGVADPSDPGGPAPVDSVNVWPWLMGEQASSPRQLVVLDHNMYDVPNQGVTGALVNGSYKLLVGAGAGESMASWYGRFSPNATNPVANLSYYACPGRPTTKGALPGCLFDLDADATEHHDIAAEQPEVFASLLALFHSFNSSYHPPVPNPPSDEAGLCAAAIASGGIVTPWKSQPLPEHTLGRVGV
jgi:arylsulfatase B